jgi:hypothetical protein
MKKFTLTTLIALLLSYPVFSQREKEPGKNSSGGTPVNQASNSQVNLLSPADGKLFNGSEGSKPLLFRWTAIVPKPKEPVTYRLKVWQLMQGQNAVEAMRSNQPIVTKDVDNITQAAISNLYTGPCKPPYLCDFVWTVEVQLTEDNIVGKNYGAGVFYAFKFEESIKTDTGHKYKTYQPGKPVYGNAYQPPTAGGSIDKELEKSQPAKNIETGSVHGVDVKPGIKNQGSQGQRSKSIKGASYDVALQKKI